MTEKKNLDSSPWVWICVTQVFFLNILNFPYFVAVSKQTTRAIFLEIYQKRFPALKTMSEMGNPADSIVLDQCWSGIILL